MDYIKWDTRFLKLAREVSSWSKDPSTKVGAAIADGKDIISIGYNGLPRGIEDTIERLECRDLKYEIIIHGEINAILAARGNTERKTLYTYPFIPCSRCASIIIQEGITRVVSLQNNIDRWKDNFKLTRSLFEEAEIELVEYIPNILW